MPRNEPEENARYRLDRQLENLGWILDGEGKNVYLGGECKTEAQKLRLGGNLPDYVLYAAGTTAPLAVLEAKRPNKNLDAALTQGREYARLLSAPVVFASDGRIARASTAGGEALRLDGVKVDRLLPERLLARFAADARLNTSEQVIKHREQLIKMFASVEKLLRGNGIDVGMQSIYEFCIILFIKINSEMKSDGLWQKLAAASERDVMAVYADIVRVYKAKYQGIFRQTNITDAKIMQQIVAKLSDVNLTDTDIDVKGEAYEFFLKRYSKQNKSALGQHFTPRHITDLMALLLDPAVGEKIYDPFCGTGGMLMSCYHVMRGNVSRQSEIAVLNNETLFGREINYGTSQLAKMNMIIVGDGSSNIENADSLAAPARRQYDKLITNIPFNLSGAYPGRLYDSAATNGNVVCLLHCLHAVRVGGRACIIVPENFCYDAAYAEARKEILGLARLAALIRLPRATFKSYTTARTCILLFDDIGRGKTTRASRYAFIEIEKDGFSDSVWREPIDDNDIGAVLESGADFAGFPKAAPTTDYALFAAGAGASFTAEGFFYLKDVLTLKDPSELQPDVLYNEPKLCSHTNTVRRRGGGRMGRNIKGGGRKVIIEPGDLVIATLHANSGNGLFALSDDVYVATSQIVGRIREDLIDREFLLYALRRVLPQLQVNDLVGRETFKKADILDVKIPKPTAFFASGEYQKLRDDWRRASAAFDDRMQTEMDKIFGG